MSVVTSVTQLLVEDVSAHALWGATSASLSFGGQPWRLIGAMFLHGDWLHLTVNMWLLLTVGALLERYLGHARFLTLYFIAGLGGSLASALTSDVLSVGASGALFGLCGAWIVLDLVHRRSLPPLMSRPRAKEMLGFVAYNLFVGFMKPEIDNAAHLGGLAAGALLALMLPPRPAASPTRPGRVVWWLVPVAGVVVELWVILLGAVTLVVG